MPSSLVNDERKRHGIVIDYAKFRRPPRIIGDEHDEISFCCPSGVAVSKTGIIYVADQQNQCIKMIPLLGNEKHVLSRPFNRPKGVHVDELGRILVTEQSRLLILDNDLNILKAIGDHGSKPGQFNIPWGKILLSNTEKACSFVNVRLGIATDSSLNMYVCDQMNNRIQKFDVDGRFLLEWGYEGEHPGQFYYPHFISISGNRVAVSDQLNHRVQIFDCFGHYHYKIGESGIEPGQLTCPFGVCIDSHGHLAIADHDNNRVQLFDDNGDVQLILDRETNPLFDFQGVHGLALTPDGGLLITDYKRSGKHRLFIFA
jgi:tripartite motif-containing protein 71